MDNWRIGKGALDLANVNAMMAVAIASSVKTLAILRDEAEQV